MVLAAVGHSLGCASLHNAASPEWVATWQASPQLTETRNMPPAPGLAGMTLRQRFHLSLGGSRIRIRLSNEYGDGGIEVGAGYVGHSTGIDGQDAGTGSVIQFQGRPSVAIPAGGFTWSDDIVMPTDDRSDIAVSLYFTRVPSGITGHPGSRTASYIVAGNHVKDDRISDAVLAEHWYVVSNLEVMRGEHSAVVAVLGNSIADGRGSGTELNNRWPDNLAHRLSTSGSTPSIAVSNAGIGGNAVLRGGLGPTALVRFDRDILAQRVVRWVIISEGVNDIGASRGADSTAAVAGALIQAYHSFITRAHAHGVRAYGATILPFGGSQYGSAEHERARTAVNRWIRQSGAFDAVIDFDAVMRDPADPQRLRHALDSGDHLHPNESGYVALADAIDLRLFSPPM
ncbi:SGNH/GDSL hydrolase family protein [soil metagenome]